MNADGTATVDVVAPACTGGELSLVSYKASGATWETAGIQTRFDIQSKVVTKATSFKVNVPSCYYQLDLITGTDAPATLSAGVPYFFNHDSLLSHYNGGTTGCVEPTTTATTPTSSPTLPTSVEATVATKTPPTTPPAVVAPATSSTQNAVVAASALPFTGSSAPIGSMIALAAELIVAGGALLMILSGRRRTAGSHR